ncbi:alanine racemase [Paenibacillus sp. 1001270B_150601_E10]|uniref:alanine racemase n=1 Tax=Paenibacillus sp. 1001270B_150601_E10 TaxID=2787079 RepID=UPI001E65C9C2|nr:alanine racemase [Paenibacillus sp. 1001270B_150601_E10]
MKMDKEAYYRPTCAEVNVSALRHNIQAFRSALPVATKLSLCVKANAYGHGAIEVARVAEEEGVDYLNVAFLDEAIQLRNAGISIPILVLGYTPPEGIPSAYFHNITLTVFSYEVLEKLEEAGNHLCVENGGRQLKVHVKMDSGMGRLGLCSAEELTAYVARLRAIDGVQVEGVFTHFACADEQDKSYTELQHKRFEAAVQVLIESKQLPPIVHTSNSAAAIDLSAYHHDMVRVGISLYGLYPSKEVNHQRIKLEPVLAWKTQVVHVKKMKAHEAISYGARYKTEQDEWIATLPVGYADGYSRLLGGKVDVLIRGIRVPVVGTICMDQCMISLSPLGELAREIHTGEEVILVGRQGDECIAIAELADHMGTIHYEVACMLAHRLPRVYVESGHLRTIHNPLIMEPK